MLNRMKILLRGVARRVYVYGVIYNVFCRLFRLRPHVVMLESHQGADFIGNPHAIALHLLSRTQYRHFKLVIVGGKKGVRGIAGDFPERDLAFVRKGGVRYCFYLAVAGWLVNDMTFPLYFSRRSGQQYLNTWHGTPLKALGRDVAGETFTHVLNTQRNFLHSTLLLAPNAYAENIFLDAYMLRGIWKGDIARCGYPRNDVLFGARERSLPSGQLDIAFMPTWRGNFTTHKQASFVLLDELKSLFQYLDRGLPSHVTLWVRLHPMVSGRINLAGYDRIRSFPEEGEPYTHLARCHALITDYSSVMFDFASTLRPILLYTPDADVYQAGRGMYMTLDDLPFSRFESPESLLAAVLAVDPINAEPGRRYMSFVERFCAWDDGSNTQRLCSSFFGGQQLVEVHHCELSRKRKVLFYVGGLLNNGIVRSFKTLLPMLDREKFDITILADTSHEAVAAESYFRELGRDVKYIPLKLCVYVGPLEAVKVAALYFFGKQWLAGAGTLKAIWARECRRLLGGARFDAFINFNGYSWRAACVSMGVDVDAAIYVHNEMAKEIAARRVADARLLRLSYEMARVVAIVREGVEREYCQREYDYTGKVVFTPNPLLMDVAHRATAPLEEAFAKGRAADDFYEIQHGILDESKFTFVNVARFSPEKGQLRLIEAFEKVWERNRNVQLLIIGGHGVSLADVEARRKSSLANDSIFIVIGSANPFPLVRFAHAFVFSSFYEGIGLVLFEAMQLGIPIVSTSIPGPRELLAEGYGLVVDNSVEGLIDGMQAAVDRKVPVRRYDFERHNAFALSQFEKCVEQCVGSP